MSEKIYRISYLDLLRKYKGKLSDATPSELRDAREGASKMNGGMMAAIYRARKAYKKEIKESKEHHETNENPEA